MATGNRYLLIPGILACITLFLGAGCGYSFRATGEPLGLELESISIALAESTSSNLAFESDFTRILREQFIGHAKVAVLSRAEAQSILNVRVYDIRAKSLTYDYREESVEGHSTTYGLTNSRRLKIRADAELTDRGTGNVIWSEKGMEERASYSVSTDPLADRYNERLALERIARKLAERIYMKTMERF